MSPSWCREQFTHSSCSENTGKSVYNSLISDFFCLCQSHPPLRRDFFFHDGVLSVIHHALHLTRHEAAQEIVVLPRLPQEMGDLKSWSVIPIAGFLELKTIPWYAGTRFQQQSVYCVTTVSDGVHRLPETVQTPLHGEIWRAPHWAWPRFDNHHRKEMLSNPSYGVGCPSYYGLSDKVPHWAWSLFQYQHKKEISVILCKPPWMERTYCLSVGADWLSYACRLAEQDHKHSFTELLSHTRVARDCSWWWFAHATSWLT